MPDKPLMPCSALSRKRPHSWRALRQIYNFNRLSNLSSKMAVSQLLQCMYRPTHKSFPRSLHHQALVPPRRLIWILCLLNLCNHQLKCLGDIFIELRASFCPRTGVFLCQLLCIFCSDLALLGPQITLVADEDHRYPISSLMRMLECPRSLFAACWKGVVPSDLESCHG